MAQRESGPDKAPHMWRLGEFTLDVQLNQLARDGQVQRLEPTSIDLLVHLLEAAPQVVSSAELLDRFWSGRPTEEGAVHRRISQIRKALDDRARTRTYIETVPKRGYRIVADVEPPADADIRDAPVPSYGAGVNRAVVDAPVLAVLPLATLGPADESYLADGFQEDILTLLATRGLKVVSRTSTALCGAAANRSMKDIANVLGVSHVVEGSVRCEGDMLRVTVQLIDARSDLHLWAATFDRPRSELFAIQTELADAIATAVATRLSDDFDMPPPDQPTADADAYDMLLKARALMRTGIAEDLAEAEQLLERTVAADPDLAVAHATLAEVLLRRSLADAEWFAVCDRAMAASDRALALDAGSAWAHFARANICASWHGDADAADAAYQRALELAPCDAEILARYGTWLGAVQARPDAGLPYLWRAQEQDPLAPDVCSSLARALLDTDQAAAAAEITARGLEYSPANGPLRYMNASLQFARGDHVEFMTTLRFLVEHKLATPHTLFVIARHFWLTGELTAAQLWSDRLGRAAPEHPLWFLIEIGLQLASGNAARLVRLTERWQIMNSNRQTSLMWDGAALDIGAFAPVWLLNLRADAELKAGSISEAEALLASATARATPLLVDKNGAPHPSVWSMSLLQRYAANLQRLKRNDAAATILNTMLEFATPDPYHEYTGHILAAHALLGELDAALDFAEANTAYFPYQYDLDEIAHNLWGVFDELVAQPRFAAFYADTKRRNADFRTRVRRELPALMDGRA